MLATIDCTLVALELGRATAPYRTNSSSACLVLEGEGRSEIGETTLEWSRNDIFTLPLGHPISHRAAAPGTVLFAFSDREILARLDLLREDTDVPR